MAIKMKYSEITNGELLRTLHKIASSPINPRETHKIKKIAKMMKEVMKHSSEISTKFQHDILPEFAVKRTDGTYIDREEQRSKPFEIIKEKEGEYKVALDKFNEQEIELASEKLNWKDIAHANIKPMDVLQLEALFNEESLDEIPEDGEIANIGGPGIPGRQVSGAPQPTNPLRSM